MTKMTKGSFLPETYQVPDKAKQFMKLTPGDNLLRILSAPLLGWVFFTEDMQPIRRSFDEGEYTTEELMDLKGKKRESGEFEGSKHFWIMLVWDFEADAPKILELTQVSILKPLYGLISDEDWGDLRGYNVNIKREGTGKNDTSFEVVPKPKKILSKKIEETIKALDDNHLLDLNAIWQGKYPFEIYNY